MLFVQSVLFTCSGLISWSIFEKHLGKKKIRKDFFLAGGFEQRAKYAVAWASTLLFFYIILQKSDS